jgi:SAM-dependent methyltransferase
VGCAETFERLGRPLKRASIVLDFGVGWGRVGRFFLNDIAPENLIGIDVDHTLVTMCRSLFSASRFEICSSHPPTELASRSVDFVVGYSVFSHLSEAACIAWMSEFGRLLRPGGIAALTTRGRWFFDYCASLRDTVTDGYTRGLATLFSDFESATARYDSGELVFSTNSDVAGGVRDSSFYGETFIPESYAARAFPDMKLAEFQFEAGHHTHPIMFFVSQE